MVSSMVRSIEGMSAGQVATTNHVCGKEGCGLFTTNVMVPSHTWVVLPQHVILDKVKLVLGMSLY